MKASPTNLLEAESSYLSGVEEKIEAAKGRTIQGDHWQTARHDDSDRLRALMASHRKYDREMLKTMPHNRRIEIHGFRRTWWFRKKRTGVVVASVLCPLESLVTGQDPAPVDLADLQDHVRRLVTDPNVEHLISVCAPSGFTGGAMKAKLELPNVTLVLVAPDENGGWKVDSPRDDLPQHVLAMFDPENDAEKLERVREAIKGRSADLLTGGLSASSIAASLKLPRATVLKAVQQAADTDPELRVSRQADDLLIYRGVAGARRTETFSMNVVDRIRQIFAKEGDEAQKINMLAERRARLAERRDRLYEDIAKLEDKESALLKQGKESGSQVTRRRLAAQLNQLRKDISRQNTTANMLNQQINIISTDIHNLTLIQQGNMAQLPSTEDLTENAVKAEEMLESLQVDAQLVSGLETGQTELATSDEELEILKEFEKAEETPAESERPPATAERPSAITAEAPPPEKSKSRPQADPEAS